MKVKVCGMKEPEDIRQVISLGVDMLGFIFHKDSPRCIKNTPSTAGNLPDYADEEICESLNGQSVERVGVFMDEMPQDIITQTYNYRLDYVQLMGEENPIYIENVRRTLVPDIVPEVKIIKAIPISDEGSFRQTEGYEGLVDVFLFTSQSAPFSEDEKKFDWDLLNHYQGDTPFILSGGIDLADAEELLSLCHPRFMGVDLTINFEKSVGMKDVEKLKKMLNCLHNKGDRTT